MDSSGIKFRNYVPEYNAEHGGLISRHAPAHVEESLEGVYFNYLFADFRASSSDALKMLYDQVAPVTASTFLISWDSSNFLG